MNIFRNSSLIQKRSTFSFAPLAHKSLSLFQFSVNNIKSTINKLAPYKAHGHMISIRMINLRNGSLYKPLEIIFFNPRNFSSRIQKANVAPVNKKWDQTWKTIDQCLFFQCLAKYLKDSFIRLYTLSRQRSYFVYPIRYESCMNEFITITHDIFKGFGDGLEVRGIFLDISKAFDSVWDEVPI